MEGAMETDVERAIMNMKGMAGESESLMVAYINSETMESTMLMEVHNIDMLVSAICNVFDKEMYEDGKGTPFTNMFSTIMITYCKYHPDFATRFIEAFNRAVYGI